jgi:hypothetical protein
MATFPAHFRFHVGPDFWNRYDGGGAPRTQGGGPKEVDAGVVGGLLESLMRALWRRGAAREAHTLRACPPEMRQVEYVLSDESRDAMAYVVRGIIRGRFNCCVETVPVDAGGISHQLHIVADRDLGVPLKLCSLRGPACARAIMQHAEMKRVRFMADDRIRLLGRAREDVHTTIEDEQTTIGRLVNRY